MATTQHDYATELDNVLRAFDKRYQALVETEDSLTKWMAHERQQALNLAKLETEYRPLARDAENDAKVYSQINQRQKEINLTGMLKANNVRILDRAAPPGSPVSPLLSVNLPVGAVAGLIFGLLLAFTIESLDNTIKSPEAAEEMVGAPLLGVVPMLSQSRQHSAAGAPDRDMAVFRDPTSLAAEACRSIRTNMLFIAAQKEFSLFSVTSPGPQDGKTTVAINLGVAMAQAGGRILLIDADLRRPRIHRSFGLKSDIGISSVIAGDIPLKNAICKSEVPGLDILPCGPIPPNPAELLHTERFRQLLAECRGSYDRVILDSPPHWPGYRPGHPRRRHGRRSTGFAGGPHHPRGHQIRSSPTRRRRRWYPWFGDQPDRPQRWQLRLWLLVLLPVRTLLPGGLVAHVRNCEIVHLADPSDVDLSTPRKMRDALKHRGPDAAGIWFSPNRRVGLAHTQLSIVDLTPTGAAHPMSTPDGLYTIVFNGDTSTTTSFANAWLIPASSFVGGRIGKYHFTCSWSWEAGASTGSMGCSRSRCGTRRSMRCFVLANPSIMCATAAASHSLASCALWSSRV